MMTRCIIALVFAIYLTGCPNTDRYESDDVDQPTTGGDTDSTGAADAGGTVVPQAGTANAPTMIDGGTTPPVTMTGGTNAAAGGMQTNLAGAQAAGISTEGSSAGHSGGHSEGAAGHSGGTDAGGMPTAGDATTGGIDGLSGGTTPSNPFNTPTGGLGNDIDIPDTCMVRFTATLPAWSPANDIYLAGTLKWPSGTEIPAPGETDEWQANGDCNPDRVAAPDSLKCNWNPNDPELRMSRNGLTATLELELPHLAEVDYKYTRGAWCTVEKRVNDCQEVMNRRQTVNCGGPQQTFTDTVEQWFDTCPNSDACN